MTERTTEPLESRYRHIMSIKTIGIGIIESQGRYVVGVRRDDQPLAGMAEFPGGKCEAHETVTECVVRECHEETGLCVEPLELLERTQFEYPHATVDLHFWLCRATDPVAEPQSGFRWVPRADLSTMQFPAANASIVRTLLQRVVCWSCVGLLFLSSLMTVQAQGLKPEIAPSKMTVAEGFEVRLVASEPLVMQPVAIDFDDRGRLWVIQYLQYPNPEGLKRVQVDRYSRTKYDRVPEPPPKGPRGADRISILEDTDGDGRMDRSKDFVNGLNLTTGFAFGHGGVFVLNVPYLLFYPDRNRDDVPDSDPEVLLSGFGMEDAHSVANSLMFGPDGWLYGCQGSTVTANIRGIEFQQGVWRYHPLTRVFELFCEGGGNSWGLDFDRTGRLLYSTNWGGNLLLHGVQGGYYVKSFGKHGALHNPHAYGYFEHALHQNFRGGHVTVGGIVYQGDLFPESYRDKYIAADLLGHGVYWHHLNAHGSTVRSQHGGELLVANDNWFAPTDVTLGPDGAVYVADWHDARTAHPDPDADWDRSNGRLYRIGRKGEQRAPAIDLTKLSVDELLKLHAHRNQWFVRRARQELVRRSVKWDSIPPASQALITTPKAEATVLEALWTRHVLGGFSEELAKELLKSPHAAVRAWTVRLLGDARQISTEMAHVLDDFAEQEPDISVRQQLACTAARLPAHQAMPIINANINRDLEQDLKDPFMPLLWWWAVEAVGWDSIPTKAQADVGTSTESESRKTASGTKVEQRDVLVITNAPTSNRVGRDEIPTYDAREEILKRFVRPSLWKSRLGRDVLLPKLVRRFAAEGSKEGLDSIMRLLNAAPSQAARSVLSSSIQLGLDERPAAARTSQWLQMARGHEFGKFVAAESAPTNGPSQFIWWEAALEFQHPEIIERTLIEAFRKPTSDLLMLRYLKRVQDERMIEPCLQLVEGSANRDTKIAALELLSKFDRDDVTRRLLAVLKSSSDDVLKSRIRDVLIARPASAKALLLAVDRADIAATALPLEQVRRIALFNDESLDALVTKHWGKLQGATREEKLAEVRRLNNDLRAGGGNPAMGQQLFKKHCAACHQLFGEGQKIGPDLTTANRKDRDFMLISLVDPNSVIRKEFVSVVIQTKNGRVLTGLPIERSDSAITLADAKGEKQLVPLNEIEELHESPTSLMPDNLYRQFKPQELRDLFSFMQSR